MPKGIKGSGPLKTTIHGKTRARTKTGKASASTAGLNPSTARDNKQQPSLAAMNKQFQALSPQKQSKFLMTNLASAIAYGKANPATG